MTGIDGYIDGWIDELDSSSSILFASSNYCMQSVSVPLTATVVLVAVLCMHIIIIIIFRYLLFLT
jgi:hypothetical protein